MNLADILVTIDRQKASLTDQFRDWETLLSQKSAGIVEKFSEFYISKAGGDFVAKFLRICSVLLPNGWMDQDATWYGGRPSIGPGHIVLDGDPAPLQEGAQQRCPPPLFGPWPCILWSSGQPSQQLLSSCFKLESAHKFWRGEGSSENTSWIHAVCPNDIG